MTADQAQASGTVSSQMIVIANCLDWLPTLEADCCDSCVTDPPYDLGFMGKHWDRQGVAFRPETWAAVLRVLKPGAHLLAFGGTRTYHRLVCAIEDAGFEIRDSIAWLYGQGFPKSLDVSKALDKRAGAEREIVGPGINYEAKCRHAASHNPDNGNTYYGSPDGPLVTAPATPEARLWQGWGTALKPAMELICIARKALSEKNVAENVLRWGTGAINVDGCRIEHHEECRLLPDQYGDAPGSFYAQGGRHGPTLELKPTGRWPANVVLDEGAGALLDAQAGQREVSGSAKKGELIGHTCNPNGMFQTTGGGPLHNDTGGASRFFYCPKASRRERGAGCEDLASQKSDVHNLSSNACARCGFRVKANGSGQKCECGPLRQTIKLPRPANHHPTVKPIALMRWLIRLVTPPGGVVLEPFAGSGSTCIAAGLEGFDFLACEQEPEYVEIAEARIAREHDKPQLPLEPGR